MVSMSASPSSSLLQTDLFLWQSLRMRRRKDDPLRGLDGTAYRWTSRARHARSGLVFLHREARAVVELAPRYRDLSDARLNEEIQAIRERFSRRRVERSEFRPAMAAVREVARREREEDPYPEQIMGALGLAHGQIVEMVTGEGKTLTAALAATVLGWRRRPVHLVTVNDYLAQRDAADMAPIYRRCGLQAEAVVEDTPPADRARIYRLPIVATTQKQLVADWLRDQLQLGHAADPVSMRWRLDDPTRSERQAPVLVPGLHVAIVDELDAVLIDEAVTPLIIANPRGEEAQAGLYERARDLAGQLEPKTHFTVDHLHRRVDLKNAGRERIEQLLGDDEHAIYRARRRREELVKQALVAQYCYHAGQQYQLVEERVVIVDEYTGRFMPDREWQHGLHQAVEAKHHLPITANRDTLASMSFQRFFRLYPHLCGMTGTAADSTAELERTYGLPVRVIPTHRPIRRTRGADRVYATASLKWRAVVEEIRQMHEAGRPVLVGTRSIEASEHLHHLLDQAGLTPQVLNAVHHKEEADIVSGAGVEGKITVATNMAGRGTDIKLGRGVAEKGGLHVILTEVSSARRIDRQLTGRAGRQGDPGSSRLIVSLDDDLLIRYAPRVSDALRRRFEGRTEPLPRWVMRVFRLAQRRAEFRAARARQATLKREAQLDQALPT